MSRDYEIPFNMFIEEILLTIDEYTSIKIKDGFEFEGYTFSMSEFAQLNWNSIKNAPRDLFPLSIGCKDIGSYMLELDKLDAWYNTMFSYKQVILNKCSDTKLAISKCTSVDDALVIFDSYIRYINLL